MSGSSSAAAAPSNIAVPSTSSATQMTLLDELFDLDKTPMAEVKKEEPQSDDEAGAGPVAEVASDNFSPAAKRRRRSTASAGSALGTVNSSRTTAGEEAKGKKGCIGCGRLRDGSCFRVPGQKVVWLYSDERGAFCLECHTVWRLAFEKTHTLSLFSVWLAEPVNLLTFQTYLLAVHSFGDLALIRRDALEARVELLRWFALMMGVPLQAFRVALLEAGGLSDEPDFDSRRLVPVETAGGLRWGVMQPQTPDFAAFCDLAFRRPFFNQWTRVPTTTPEEDELLTERFGLSARLGNAAGANEAAGSVLVAVDAASTLVPALPASKNHAKFELWVASAKKFLSLFETDGWKAATEKTVKNPLAAASAFLVVAGSEGHNDLHEQAAAWVAGLGMVQKLFRLLRYGKTTKKKALLAANEKELEGPLVATAAFLKGRGVRPGTSFQLLVLRSRLLQACMAGKAVAGPFQECSRELADTFREAAEAGVVKPQVDSAGGIPSARSARPVNVSLWLRSLFTDILPEIIPKAAAADERPLQAKVLYDDLEAVMDSLKHAFGEFAPARFLAELAAVCVVLSGAAGLRNSSALAVKQALQTVRSEPMVLFVAALASPLWDLAQVTAAELLQLSSKDALADSKMERALAILRDPRLPQLDFSATVDGSERVYPAGFGHDESLMADLGESLLAAAEAQSLWSDLQAESQAPLVKSWAEALCRTLTSINELHWVCLAGCFEQAGIDMTLEETAAPAETFLDDFVPGVTAEALENLETALGDLADCEPLIRCTEQVAQQFASFSQALKVTVGTDALSDQFLVPLVQSHKLRAAVFEVASALAAVPYPVDCPEALVEDWRQKQQQQGSVDATDLSLVLGLLRAVGQLRALPRSPADRPARAVAVHLRYGEEGSAEVLPVSLDKALSLDRLVLCLPFAASLERTSQACIQHIWNSLVLAVNLPGANFQPVAVTVPGSMREVFASFFQSDEGVVLAQAAAKPLSQKSYDCETWPFQDCRVVSASEVALSSCQRLRSFQRFLLFADILGPDHRPLTLRALQEFAPSRIELEFGARQFAGSAT